MKQFIQKHKRAIAGVATCLAIGAATMSFQTLYGPMEKLDTLTELQDTIPPNNNNSEPGISMKEYDELMGKMDKKIIQMQEESC